MILWLALLAMAVDHVNWLFIGSSELFLVGRVAAPVFCFFVGAGWRWSRAKHDRLKKFFIFACVSQLFYYLCFFWGGDQLNILFLFFAFGLLVVYPRHFWSWGVCLVLARFCEYGYFGLFVCAAGYLAVQSFYQLHFLSYSSRWRFLLLSFSTLAFLIVGAWGIHGPDLWAFSVLVLSVPLLAVWAFPVLLWGRYLLGRFALWYFYPGHLALLALAAVVVS